MRVIDFRHARVSDRVLVSVAPEYATIRVFICKWYDKRTDLPRRVNPSISITLNLCRVASCLNVSCNESRLEKHITRREEIINRPSDRIFKGWSSPLLPLIISTDLFTIPTENPCPLLDSIRLTFNNLPVIILYPFLLQ